VTDDDGKTAEARTTTTTIRPAPPGSPSVTATASPLQGNAPLTVTFGGSASDDGSIVLWEWDFDGDGTWDFSSPTSPATSRQYVDGGIFAAALRATDDSGMTGIDNVEIVVNLVATLSIPDDTFDPGAGETAPVATTLSAGVPVHVFLKNAAGATVRTLFQGFRAAGSYSDPWDGRDDAGALLPSGPYHAVLTYDFSGQTRVVDASATTGGLRYNPTRNNLPSTFRPYEDDLLDIVFTVPAIRGASEVQAFIGLFNNGTRFITLLERVPFGVGTHTIHWDGLDADGRFAVPPPGESFLFGIFGFTLPDNAIVVQSAPVLSNVRVTPNYFDPATPTFLGPENPLAVVAFDLDRTALVELTVTNLATGQTLAQVTEAAVPAGPGHTISWDGRAAGGLYADRGDYRLTLRAIDSTGSPSIARFALVRVFY
jgi:PKD repeat protein